jgi:hypothetical protein
MNNTHTTHTHTGVHNRKQFVQASASADQHAMELIKQEVPVYIFLITQWDHYIFTNIIMMIYYINLCSYSCTNDNMFHIFTNDNIYHTSQSKEKKGASKKQKK